jgi:hypothetical protein
LIFTAAIIPKQIKHSPIIFPAVTGSWKNIELHKRTRIKLRPINGYAKDNSNLLIAAIQHKEAMNAERKPDITNGSENTCKKY